MTKTSINITHMPKLQLLVTALTLLIFLPCTTSAIGEFYDPIYVKIEPTQSTKNAQTVARLKSQYGVSAFYKCYPCSGQDTSSPYTEANCLSHTEYCLERQQIFNSGNTKIEDPDTGCKNNYGANSYYNGNKSANGSYICDCKGGYKWNDSKTTCISDDRDSDCKKIFGSYSYWTGQGHICDCLSGYEWQDDFCVHRVDKSQLTALPGEELSERKIYILKSLDDLIGSNPVRATPTCGEYNANLGADGSCQCANGYGYSETRKVCVKKLVVNPVLQAPPADVPETQNVITQPAKIQPNIITNQKIKIDNLKLTPKTQTDSQKQHASTENTPSTKQTSRAGGFFRNIFKTIKSLFRN